MRVIRCNPLIAPQVEDGDHRFRRGAEGLQALQRRDTFDRARTGSRLEGPSEQVFPEPSRRRLILELKHRPIGADEQAGAGGGCLKRERQWRLAARPALQISCEDEREVDPRPKSERPVRVHQLSAMRQCWRSSPGRGQPEHSCTAPQLIEEGLRQASGERRVVRQVTDDQIATIAPDVERAPPAELLGPRPAQGSGDYAFRVHDSHDRVPQGAPQAVGVPTRQDLAVAHSGEDLAARPHSGHEWHRNSLLDLRRRKGHLRLAATAVEPDLERAPADGAIGEHGGHLGPGGIAGKARHAHHQDDRLAGAESPRQRLQFEGGAIAHGRPGTARAQHSQSKRGPGSCRTERPRAPSPTHLLIMPGGARRGRLCG